MKKRICNILLMVLLLFTVAGCGTDTTAVDDGIDKEQTTTEDENNSQEPTGPAEPEAEMVLKIGALQTQQAKPLEVIVEQGMDKKQGYTLEIVYFEDVKTRDQALQNGELDGCLSDYVSICSYQQKEFMVKTIGIADDEYVLLATKVSGINSVDQCKNAKTAVVLNTVAEYTLDYIIAQSNYRNDFLNKVGVNSYNECVTMFQNNEVDVCIVPRGYATAILKDAITLGDSRQLRLYPDVTCVLQSVIDHQPECIDAFLESYDLAVTYLNTTDRGEFEYRVQQLPTDEELEDPIFWTKNKEICTKTIDREDLIYDAAKNAE